MPCFEGRAEAAGMQGLRPLAKRRAMGEGWGVWSLGTVWAKEAVLMRGGLDVLP